MIPGQELKSCRPLGAAKERKPLQPLQGPEVCLLRPSMPRRWAFPREAPGRLPQGAGPGPPQPSPL